MLVSGEQFAILYYSVIEDVIPTRTGKTKNHGVNFDGELSFGHLNVMLVSREQFSMLCYLDIEIVIQTNEVITKNLGIHFDSECSFGHLRITLLVSSRTIYYIVLLRYWKGYLNKGTEN